MDLNTIEVHYRDGRILRGFTLDLFPTKPTFHLTLAEASPGAKSVDVEIAQLKAIRFLKAAAGEAAPAAPGPAGEPKPAAVGRKIRVLFQDGELLLGTTQGYDASRPGFFVVPTAREPTIDRIFVVKGATQHVSFL